MRITDIDGVFGNGIHCGIKAVDTASNSQVRDLAFIYVPTATACAAVTTKNRFAAACVERTRECLISGNTIKAVVINSGNANAATGDEGRNNAQRTAELAAEMLGLRPAEVTVASTGIIGKQLPMDKVIPGLETLLQNKHAKNGDDVAQAILTTDTFRKSVFIERVIGGKKVQIAGIAKGAGMIAPNMATMLSFIAMDASISQAKLQHILSHAVDRTFNMISVDTDTSTNDMVLLFSSGKVELNSQNSEVEAELSDLIREACLSLSRQIILDGEGAEKIIKARVCQARSFAEAKKIAKSIIDSPLVKTAIHGGDPNWGRLLMAIGKTEGVEFAPEEIEVSLGGHLVFSRGRPSAVPREDVAKSLKAKEVEVLVNLQVGEEEATAWGCDLSKAYVELNTEYN